MHAQSDVVTVVRPILNGLPNFFRQLRSQNFVRIQKKNPVVCQRKRIHGPLPLLRPATVIMKLHHLRPKSPGDLSSLVRTARVNHVNFAHPAQRFQTARQILRLIERRNNHADRQKPTPKRAQAKSGFLDDLHMKLKSKRKSLSSRSTMGYDRKDDRWKIKK